MGSMRFWLLAGLAALMAVTVSGPALAAWTYTAASPLVFEFGDNNNNSYEWLYPNPAYGTNPLPYSTLSSPT